MKPSQCKGFSHFLAYYPTSLLFVWLTEGRGMKTVFVDAGYWIAILNPADDLYKQRADKAWSHTDCASFCIMQQQNILEALTHDRHFEQAGFVALLR